MTTVTALLGLITMTIILFDGKYSDGMVYLAFSTQMIMINCNDQFTVIEKKFRQENVAGPALTLGLRSYIFAEPACPDTVITQAYGWI